MSDPQGAVRWLALTPVDAWTFRDGRPGSPWTGASMDLECTFPPPPTTVIGAIRAALARGRGWSGFGDWKDAGCTPVLGDGIDDLGVLKFHGPFLTINGEPLFAAPAHLLGRGKVWSPVSLMVPPEQGTFCDLGAEVRLPAALNPDSPEEFKESSGLFITATGLRSVVAGIVPAAEDVVPRDKLFEFERRIGLEIDFDTGTAMEGQLYSPQFVRLQRDVALVVGVEGLPADWEIPSFLPIGGESRIAACERTSFQDPALHQASALQGRDQAAIILLTPARINNLQDVLRPGTEIIPRVVLVAACCDRPTRLGGWSFRTKAPEPQEPHLPAGSVLFAAWSDERARTQLAETKGIGERQSHGYGKYVLGVWPQTHIKKGDGK